MMQPVTIIDRHNEQRHVGLVVWPAGARPLMPLATDVSPSSRSPSIRHKDPQVRRGPAPGRPSPTFSRPLVISGPFGQIPEQHSSWPVSNISAQLVTSRTHAPGEHDARGGQAAPLFSRPARGRSTNRADPRSPVADGVGHRAVHLRCRCCRQLYVRAWSWTYVGPAPEVVRRPTHGQRPRDALVPDVIVRAEKARPAWPVSACGSGAGRASATPARDVSGTVGVA